MTLEVLHRPFVGLGSFPRLERPQIAALASLRVLLSRVKTKLAWSQFANHRVNSKLRCAISISSGLECGQKLQRCLL